MLYGEAILDQGRENENEISTHLFAQLVPDNVNE